MELDPRITMMQSYNEIKDCNIFSKYFYYKKQLKLINETLDKFSNETIEILQKIGTSDFTDEDDLKLHNLDTYSEFFRNIRDLFQKQIKSYNEFFLIILGVSILTFIFS